MTAATPTPTPTPTATPTPTNVAAVVLDAGPSGLSNGNTSFNEPFVTVTICAPGSTTNCQTIDHVELDTGSVGLRILKPVLNATLLAALPVETDPAGNPVGECYQYVASYAFGSVRQADFRIAGESVADMPFQLVADTGAFATVPSGCSSGAGAKVSTINDLDANAIIGIGATASDCGAICQSGESSGATYYDCPSTGCVQVIARGAATVAPFQQLPNPVAAFATDNNGSIITLPAVAQAGAVSLNGTITFGIGTQPDNSLTATTLLTLTTSSSNLGPGYLTAAFNGKSYRQSYFDTGSSVYYFVDDSLVACPKGAFYEFYCPASPTLLSLSVTGLNGVTASADFTLYNPMGLANTINVAPGLGIDTDLVPSDNSGNGSFGFGLPFFFGRTIYIAIEGANASGTPGPYVPRKPLIWASPVIPGCTRWRPR